MNLESLIPIFASYGILLSFLGGLFGGEEIIIALSFLSAAGFFSIWWVAIFATIGVFISDIVVLMVGRTRFIGNFNNLEKYSKVYQKVDNFIVKVSRNHLFLTLLYTKFLYGTRVLTLLYLGIKKVNVAKFILYDFIVVCIWMVPVVIVGWLGGNGYKMATTIFKSFEITTIVVVFFIIFLILIRKWTKIELLKLPKQLN